MKTTGLVLATQWGEGSAFDTIPVSDGAPAKQRWSRHWLLGAEISGHSERRMVGLRTTFSHYQEQTLLRVGPFMGGKFFRRELPRVRLALFGEGSLYLDTRLFGPGTVRTQSAGFAFVPGVGLGLDLGLKHRLHVSVYGGPNYVAYIQGGPSYWGGELRTSLLYVFGEANAPKPSVP